jgi:hypothetical protein
VSGLTGVFRQIQRHICKETITPLLRGSSTHLPILSVKFNVSFFSEFTQIWQKHARLKSQFTHLLYYHLCVPNLWEDQLPKNKMEYRDVSLWALEVHGTQGASYTLFRTHPDRNMVEEYMGTCSGVGMKNVDKEGTLSYQPAVKKCVCISIIMLSRNTRFFYIILILESHIILLSSHGREKLCYNNTILFEKKKVGGGCALPGADIQKPYTSKCGEGKIKIDLFRYFLQKLPISKLRILFQLKFPACICQCLYNMSYQS